MKTAISTVTQSVPDMESHSESQIESNTNTNMTNTSMFATTPLIMNDIQYLSLTKVKFDALPMSTRGRCKYTDISGLYQKMINYAQNYTIKPYTMAQLQQTDKRRHSMKSNFHSNSNELPPMSYGFKELIAGVPPNTVPFTSSLSAPRVSTNKEYSMKISGKTGSNMLTILKSLNLITYNQLNTNSDTGNDISINLTEDVEDYMFDYIGKLKKNKGNNVTNTNTNTTKNNTKANTNTNTNSNVLNDTNMSIIME